MVAATAFVAVTAFVLAYDGSRGAAVDAGISAAGWYPFCIEGVIVCASIATIVLAARRYPWIILLLFSTISVAANVLHAWQHPGARWWSLAFAAVPPLTLPLCVHLVLMVLAHRPPAPAHQPAVQRPAVQPAVQTHPVPASAEHPRPAVAGAAPTAVHPPPVQPPPVPGVQSHARPAVETWTAPGDAVHSHPAAPSGQSRRARQAALDHLHRHRRLPTARQLATQTGVSRGTAGTVLKHLRTGPPEPTSNPPGDKINPTEKPPTTPENDHLPTNSRSEPEQRPTPQQDQPTYPTSKITNQYTPTHHDPQEDQEPVGAAAGEDLPTGTPRAATAAVATDPVAVAG